MPLVFTEPERRLSLSAQYGLVALGVPLWIAGTHYAGPLAQMPGISILLALAGAAFTVSRGPAILAIVLGTIGHELIRTPVPAAVHVQRMLVVATVGVICLALAYSRNLSVVSEKRYQALFERHPLPMFVFDEQTSAFLSVNEASVRTYGFTEAEFRSMTLDDVHWPGDAPRINAPESAVRDEMMLVTRHRTKPGRPLDVQVRTQRVPFQGRPARLVLVENITEQRELEAQLRQSQKMEAIGQLAGGIAHDFNNLLTAIRGYASLLLDTLPDGDPRRDDVLEIDRAGERAATLTRQLLAFSRKQLMQEKVFSPNEVVTGLAPMLGRLVGEHVRLRTLTKAEGYVLADPSQLEQVVMNLVVNARDALREGGEITIETADVELDELYARTHATARPGPHVVLIVSDNGHGMTPDVQARAFEPFFTTKSGGQGTGLGLSTVYGIVKQSAGHLWIYSEVGRGTTVKVYLPRTGEAPQAPPAPRGSRRPLAIAPSTVLVVEDEETVRSLLTKVLKRGGYTVHAAGTPDEARELLARTDVHLDLLITDVVLSREGGRQVADDVMQAQPRCKVLFISGYTDDAVVRYGILTEQMPFLQKPFSAVALLDKVAAILAPPAP